MLVTFPIGLSSRTVTCFDPPVLEELEVVAEAAPLFAKREKGIKRKVKKRKESKKVEEIFRNFIQKECNKEREFLQEKY